MSKPRCYRFMLSGFQSTNDERTNLVQKIQTLGGVYFDTNFLKPACTHLICCHLSRSEKVLEALATGRTWILSPKFIDDSFAALKWKDEEDYEWNVCMLGTACPVPKPLKDLYSAPQRHRLRLRNEKKGVFSKWRVFFCMNNKILRSAYKRILSSGDARILPDSTNTKNSEECKKATFVFVDDQKRSEVVELIRKNVLCISTDYIRNFIIQENPPPVTDFLITTYVSNSDPCYLALNTSSMAGDQSPQSENATDTGKMRLDAALVPLISKVDVDKTMLPLVKRPLQCILSPKKGIPRNSKRPKVDQKKSVSSCNTLDKYVIRLPSSSKKVSVSLCENVSSNVHSDKVSIGGSCASSHLCDERITLNGSSSRLVRQKSAITKGLQTVKRTVSADCIQGNIRKQVPLPMILDDTVLDSRPASGSSVQWLTEAVEEVSRLKVKQYIQDCNLRLPKFSGDNEASTEFYGIMALNLETCMDEGEIATAMDMVLSMSSAHYYPPSSFLQSLLATVRTATDKTTVSHGYEVLLKLLELHPPSCNKIRKWYLEALPASETTTAWNFVDDVISECMNISAGETFSNSELDLKSYSYLLLLNYLQRLFQLDFDFFVARSSNPSADLRQRSKQPLLVQIVWQFRARQSVNEKCRSLLLYLVECVRMNSAYKVQSAIQTIVTLMMESCRLSDVDDVKNPGYSTINESAAVLAETLANMISATSLDVKRLGLLLELIDMPWVQLVVAEKLLEDMGICNNSSSPTCLTKICFEYFCHVPKDLTTKELSSSQNAASNDDGNSNCMQEQLSPLPPRFCVNKRNGRGETPLHLACIKNNVRYLHKLLALPDVDVNVLDNARWSPLHEACNHGNVECVKALLEYKPVITSRSNFLKDGPMSKPIDMNIAAVYDITPLHDTVMCNKVEIAKLLLQYGGPKLLKAKTTEGKSPHDLAKTPEMRKLLEDFKNNHASSWDKDTSELLEMNSQEEVQSVSSNVLTRYRLLVKHLLSGYLSTYNVPELWLRTVNKNSRQVKDATDEIAILLSDLRVFGQIETHLTMYEQRTQKMCQDLDHDAKLDIPAMKILTTQ